MLRDYPRRFAGIQAWQGARVGHAEFFWTGADGSGSERLESVRGWRPTTAGKTLDQHIEITPGIAGGKPRIAGHRITVQDIVVWHEWMGRSADEIAAEYNLTLADVYAALAYYFDHRAEMDRVRE